METRANTRELKSSFKRAVNCGDAVRKELSENHTTKPTMTTFTVVDTLLHSCLRLSVRRAGGDCDSAVGAEATEASAEEHTTAPP